MSHDRPSEPFFLIVADYDRGLFSVEGPMTDDGAIRTFSSARKAMDWRNPRPSGRTKGTSNLYLLVYIVVCILTRVFRHPATVAGRPQRWVQMWTDL
jgi:hypothetical protein